jgi:mono/diheme cytochrome c family protein
MKQFLVCGLLLVGFTQSAVAEPLDVTPEQKKELVALSKSLRDTRKLLAKKRFDDVREQIAKAAAKLEEMGLEEGERDRTYKSVVKALSNLRGKLPVSFETEIAPILKENCLRCHGSARQSARLRLDTFEQMAKGGANGPLVRGTNPRNSLLVAKLTVKDEKLRMPKNGAQLPDDQILLIAKWVSQGSPFDGADRKAEIGSKPKEPEKPLVIARPDGSETVSFKKDIAPWMVGVCLGCHGDRNPRSGFSLATFEGLLRGGDRGDSLVPGNADESLLVDLVLRQKDQDGEPLKMPAGNQTRIKRSQALALEKWVNEGAKFDGGDAKAPLRDLVPTPAELEAERLAKMSSKEFSERRMKQGNDLWEEVLPRDEVFTATSPNTYVFAATEERAKQVSGWAEKDVEAIKAFFKFTNGEPWRGRLNIFVARDRFAYEEFNQALNRQTPPDMISHARITAGASDAYIVVQDVGDEVSTTSPGLRTSVTVQLADAFVQRSGNVPPRVIGRGVGLLLASKSADKSDPWFMALPTRLKGVAVARSQEVFDNGSFTPAETDAVGYALAGFMNRSGSAKFIAFLTELQNGSRLADAARKVYRQTPAQMGEAFMRSK